MSRNLLHLVLRHADGLTAAADGDAHLLRRFVASRDESAFATLVKRHGPMVWSVCRQSVPNHADAEDVFQATFLALAQSARRVRRPEHLGGWLHAAAVRIAAKAKRSFSRRQVHERKTARSNTDSPVSAVAWGELQAAVHAEVASLPPSLRAAFVLCDLEGVEVGAAAGQLGVKANTLSGQLARARQRLMAGLAKRGVAAGAVAFAAAVAVPDGLAKAVAGGVVPTPAVLELAAEVTTMGVSKLKLLAAGLLLAGGLSLSGLGLLQRADGQTPAPPGGGGAPPSSGGFLGSGGLPPGGSGAAPGGPGVPGNTPGVPGYGGGSADGGEGGGGTRWPNVPKGGEYLFAAKPGTVADVAKLLRAKGDQGWEYTGPLEVDPADPPKGKEFEGITKDTRVVLVFKRKQAPMGMGMGTGMPGMGGMLPAGGGWGGGGETRPAPGGWSGAGGDAFSGPPPGGKEKPAAFEAVISLSDVKLADAITTIKNVYAKAPGVWAVSTSGGNLLTVSAPSEAALMDVIELILKMDPHARLEAKTSPKSGGPGASGGGNPFGGGEVSQPTEEKFEVIKLKSTAAEEAVKVLHEVFNGPNKGPGRIRLVGDSRTNSIIVVKASAADMEVITKLLAKVIDTETKPEKR